MGFTKMSAIMAMLSMLAVVSADRYSDLYAKYGCRDLQPYSDQCGVSYSLSLQSQWSSNGVTYYQYGITITASSAADFPVKALNISINVGSGFIASTYGLSDPVAISGSETQYTVPIPYPSLQPGQTWSGSGFIVSGAPSATMSIKAQTCDLDLYTRYRGSLCATPVTITGQTPSGSTQCAVSYTSLVQSVYDTQYNFGTVFQLVFTNTGSCNINGIEVQVTEGSDMSLVNHWNLNSTTFLGAGGSSVTYAYAVLGFSTLAPGASYSGAGYQYQSYSARYIIPRFNKVSCQC